jgi:hypothetical protein
MKRTARQDSPTEIKSSDVFTQSASDVVVVVVAACAPPFFFMRRDDDDWCSAGSALFNLLFVSCAEARRRDARCPIARFQRSPTPARTRCSGQV